MDRILWSMYNYRIIVTVCTGLELLKVTYVIFASCCFGTKRPRALLVGIADLVLGVPGLTVIVIPVMLPFVSRNEESSNTQDGNENVLLREIAMPLIILSAFPTLTGMMTVFAVAFKNKCCANTTIFLRFLIILIWSGVLVVFTLVLISSYGGGGGGDEVDVSHENAYRVLFKHIYFFFGSPIAFALCQLYFIFVLMSFWSMIQSTSERYVVEDSVELQRPLNEGNVNPIIHLEAEPDVLNAVVKQ